MIVDLSDTAKDVIYIS